MAFWRFGKSGGNLSVAAARQKARKEIDRKNARATAALLSSNDPLQALATSLEFNFNWGCCQRVDFLTNVPKGNPGRLQTLGDGTYFCTHCRFSTFFDESYFHKWFARPESSTAGAHREPPTLEREGRDGGFEAVEAVLRALDALERDQAEGYLALLDGQDRASLRTVMRKLDRIREDIPIADVARKLREAEPRLGSFPEYDELTDLVQELRISEVGKAGPQKGHDAGSGNIADDVGGASAGGLPDADSEAAHTAFIKAEDLIADALAAGKSQINLGPDCVPDLRRLPDSIAGLEKLEILRLGAARISDLSPLSTLPKLKSIYLDGAQMLDLPSLAKLQNLEMLSLKGAAISELTGFERISGLSSLHIDNTDVADLAPLAQLGNLSLLTAKNCPIQDLTPLAGLRNLYQLSLIDTAVADLTPLTQADTLVNLSLIRTKVEDLEPLRGLSKLRVLNLDDCPIANLAPLADNKVLTNLSLGGVRLVNYGVLSSFQDLTLLSLERTSITELGPLETLCKIAYLDLSDTGVSDLRPLENLTGLRSLWLERTAVVDLGPLRHLDKLSDLRLSGTAVSDLTPLTGLNQLTTLWLNDTESLKDLSPVADLPLTKYADLTEAGLHFRGCAGATLDPDGLGKLAAIENNQKRTELALAYLRQTRSGSGHVGASLEELALSREALPEMLFFPAVQKDLRALGLGVGTVSATLEDADGNLAMIAWAKAEDAVSWLQTGGLALWRKNPRPPSDGNLVVVGHETAKFLAQDHGAGGFEKYLHFEPARGELFAPPDRRLKLS